MSPYLPYLAMVPLFAIVLAVFLSIDREGLETLLLGLGLVAIGCAGLASIWLFEWGVFKLLGGT